MTTPPEVTGEPTPADFERARQLARTFDAPSIDPDYRNLARCFVEALSRMQAAERKVEAWGPIVDAVRRGRDELARSMVSTMPEELLPKPGAEKP